MQVNIGKGLELEVTANELPQAALDHVIYIGLRNILMDAHASITADEYPDAEERQSAALAMAQKKLDALMRGEVRVASTREGDPVRAEAKAMAKAMLRTKLRAAGKKFDDYTKEAINAAIDKLITPELMAKAKARVDETRAAAPADLSDLGL